MSPSPSPRPRSAPSGRNATAVARSRSTTRSSSSGRTTRVPRSPATTTSAISAALAARALQLGCRALTLHDAVQGADLPVHLLYPTDAPATPQSFGPHAIDLALDARAIGDALPLVVISHGDGGSPGYRGLTDAPRARGLRGRARRAHRQLAPRQLARGHAGQPRQPTAPRAPRDRCCIRRRRSRSAARRKLCRIVGHSFGGYTALAVAGGRPWSLPEETGRCRPASTGRTRRAREGGRAARARAAVAHASRRARGGDGAGARSHGRA